MYSKNIRAQGIDPLTVHKAGSHYLINGQTNDDIQIVRATTLDGLPDRETQNGWQHSTPSRCCGHWATEQHEISETEDALLTIEARLVVQTLTRERAGTYTIRRALDPLMSLRLPIALTS